jgi:hypothetical protein
MRKMPYRLLCTATAAPNDYIELGTSSEALGHLGFMDMLGRFFKKAESTTSRSDEFRSGVYRFRGHGERDGSSAAVGVRRCGGDRVGDGSSAALGDGGGGLYELGHDDGRGDADGGAGGYLRSDRTTTKG